MKTIAARLLALFVFLGAAFPAFAEEFIRSYHSVIEVAADGKLTVTETITARAEGQNIKRGIFRDFPLYALDGNNRRAKVDFNVVSVERDGAPRISMAASASIPAAPSVFCRPASISSRSPTPPPGKSAISAIMTS